MQFLMSLLVLIVSAIILAVVTLLVAVDMAGKIDYIKTNFPTLVKWAERREWHGFLLLVCFGLLAVEGYELFTKEMPDIEPPKIALAGGMAEKDAEIANLRGRLEAKTPVEPPNSLRRRTIRLVNDLTVFWSRRPEPVQQPVQNPTTDEERQRNARSDKYWRDVRVAYLNAGFNERILGIVREYKNKGIETGYLEQGAELPEPPLIGSPFTGGGLESCARYPNPLCQLKELAYHVDANGQPIIFGFDK